jgi:hypothetical protein
MDPRIKPRAFSAVDMARELKNRRVDEVQELFYGFREKGATVMEALRRVATPLGAALQAKRAYDLALFNANASEELEPKSNSESENVAKSPPRKKRKKVVRRDKPEVHDEPTPEDFAEEGEEEEIEEEEVKEEIEEEEVGEEEEVEEEVEIGAGLICDGFEEGNDDIEVDAAGLIDDVLEEGAELIDDGFKEGAELIDDGFEEGAELIDDGFEVAELIDDVLEDGYDEIEVDPAELFWGGG